MSESGTGADLTTDLSTDLSIDTDTSNQPATAVAERESSAESFAPGELKWTAEKVKEEPKKAVKSVSIEASQVSSVMEKEELAPESTTELETEPTTDSPRKRWIWAASLTGVFLMSFLLGYTVLGGRYWREVFDIHTWIHLIKLLFG